MFSANSCKLVLFLPLLVITEVVELLIFKCIEVFCKKGEKDFNAYFIANNSLQVYDSSVFSLLDFMTGMCRWFNPKNCPYCTTTIV